MAFFKMRSIVIGVLLAFAVSIPFCRASLSANNATGTDDTLTKLTANSTRIVGGTWAKRGAYPYQAAIFLKNEFSCGGTLLASRRHVLTAAHCVSDAKEESLFLRFRTTVLNPPDDNYIESNVSSFVIHPEYNVTSFANDLAIITLTDTISEIRPVLLEPATYLNESYVGKEVTVIGWGRTRQVLHPVMSSGAPSNHLRQVNLTIIGDNDCSILYYNNQYRGDIKRLCASTLFGRSICQGDSGGPMLVRGDKGLYQIGINSAAAGCADPRYPALFVRVGYYEKWIHSTISDDDFSPPV